MDYVPSTSPALPELSLHVPSITSAWQMRTLRLTDRPGAQAAP